MPLCLPLDPPPLTLQQVDTIWWSKNRVSTLTAANILLVGDLIYSEPCDRGTRGENSRFLLLRFIII